MTASTLANMQRPAQVLLVEDNSGDIILTQRAFREARVETHLTVAHTGEEALQILRKEGNYTNAATPDIILLDLNLPKMDGQDVLVYIKADPTLKRIPVIILSSSRVDQDVTRSYDHHANGYIVKPAGLEGLQEIIRRLDQFWFTQVVLSNTTEVKVF